MTFSLLRRRIRILHSFSVVFLYWFYVFSWTSRLLRRGGIRLISSCARLSYRSEDSFDFYQIRYWNNFWLEITWREVIERENYMASIPRQTSSGSNGGSPSALPDERKRKRMQSNRESARRSRMRKQKQLEDLAGEVSRLQIANNQLVQSIGAKEQAFVQVDNMNNVLRAQAMELTDRLRSLNSVLHIVEEVSGLAMDIPEIPDPLLKPWELSRPVLPVADMFLC